MNASSSSAGPSPNRPCQSGRAASAVALDSGIGRSRGAVPCSARRDHVSTDEAPQAHEPGGVLVAERVLGLVGRELVVVEPAVGAAAGDEAAPGLEPQPDLAGDVPLGRVDERVERLAQRREPQAVVDELGVRGSSRASRASRRARA